MTSVPLRFFILFVFIVEGCAMTNTKMNDFPPPSTALTGQHAYSKSIKLDSTNQIKKAVKISFLFYLPDSYGKDPKKKWPLILFLHGMGERGDDLEILKNHPLPKIFRAAADGFLEFPDHPRAHPSREGIELMAITFQGLFVKKSGRYKGSLSSQLFLFDLLNQVLCFLNMPVLPLLRHIRSRN